MFPSASSPCIICHNQGDTLKKTKLQRIERLVEDLDETVDIRYNLSFGFHVHSHCRFGISCSKLSSFDSECNRIIDRIHNKIITAAVMDDDRIYRKILELCRGDFPTAYHNLETLRYQHRKRYENESN